MYKETPGASSFLVRTMAGRFEAYGVFTTAYFFVGPLLLAALWIVVAVLPISVDDRRSEKCVFRKIGALSNPCCRRLIMKGRSRLLERGIEWGRSGLPLRVSATALVL